MSSCLICKKGGGKLILVTDRGKESLKKFAKLQNDDSVLDIVDLVDDCHVHESCRKWYNNQKRIDRLNRGVSDNPSKCVMPTRSTSSAFSWPLHCFLCSHTVLENGEEWHRVENSYLKESMLKNCKDRLELDSSEDWALSVKSRLTNCFDLVAANARYHQNCRVQFSTLKHSTSAKPVGRPTNNDKNIAFELTCDWLENQTTVQCIGELAKKMSELSNEKEAYGNRWIKKLLRDKYGSKVIIKSLGEGMDDLVMFEETAKHMMDDVYMDNNLNASENQSKDENAQGENGTLIDDVGKLIREEIGKVSQGEFYPSNLELSDLDNLGSWVPDSLKKLLEIIIPDNLKRIAIGHAIVSASRRNLQSPLLFGLGVQIDHSFGSRWLNTHLSRLGFSVTYAQVRNYKMAVMEQGSLMPIIPPGAFIQWSADNVDHNCRTIDGKNTFHGMGIIASVTPHLSSQGIAIDRHTIKEKTQELSAKKSLPIIEYFGKAVHPTSMRFKSYSLLKELAILKKDRSTVYDLTWLTNWIGSPRSSFCGNWAGYMQQAFSQKNYVHKSSVIMLPLIDMSPSDPTCILSTLMFVADQARKFGMITPILTFDQPLWFKAIAIIEERKLDVLCRLGGFHLLMSFLGSIGCLMEGSGLNEVLEQVYATNVVPHMLSGKAYSRALRGHMLVQAAFFKLMFEDMLQSEMLSAEDLSILASFNPESSEVDHVQSVCEKVRMAIIKWMERVSEFRTAKYWCQYINYVDVVKEYIRAERTGDWLLHLSSVARMLNLFAATGHIHYTKSARFYLQQMTELPVSHPGIHTAFVDEGLHSIRRTDNHWAGLWSDLVIEQVMMRTIKSSGGLTRGRGFTESTHNQWIVTAHQFASINESLSSLTKVDITSSEQHKDLSIARRSQDDSDFAKVYQWLKERNPLETSEKHLISLSTGIVGKPELNCDEAEIVGEKIHLELNNRCLRDSKVKRKDMIIGLDSKTSRVIVDKKELTINSNLLFNRLYALASREDNVEKYFEYELTAYPMSLFKDGIMRKADKAVLRNLLLVKEVDMIENARKVIDGGALLHCVHWPDSMTYKSLLTHHVETISKTYGACHTVFDGYSRSSVKDQEHVRRSARNKSKDVIFTLDMKVSMKREEFLSNQNNKTLFIKHLSTLLEEHGQEVTVSIADADTDIAKVALKEAELYQTEVVADDTDVAVLLLHHWNPALNDIIFTSERSKKSWSIKDCCLELTPLIKANILPLHAFSGCDTTSALYGIGKAKVLRLFRGNDKLINDAAIFLDDQVDVDLLKKIGTSILISMYGGKENDTLRSLRFAKYQEMSARGTIDPSKLPPCESSANQHTLRAYFQCLVWKTLDPFPSDPCLWGWKLEDGLFTPIQSSNECAPADLLKFVRCKCKSGCTSNLCSCKKHGLTCVFACKNCRGDCENCEVLNVEEDFMEEGADMIDDLL